MSEKLEKAAKILTKEFERIGDIENIVASRDEVLKRYGRVFSASHIKELTWEDFAGFLDYKNNKHWHGIDLQVRLGKKLKAEFDEIKKGLNFLVDENGDIVQRFERCASIPDLKKAKITPILLVAFPKQYGVWNSVSEWCLKTLGIWLEELPIKSEKNLSGGEAYELVNQTLIELSSEMKVDLWTLDAIFWYYHQAHEDQVSNSLEELSQYSKKDLSDIFTPESFFTPNGGKWGRTGVVTVDLGLRKDYVLFSISEKFSRLDRPEVIMDDGTFDWVTQQRMKGKETETVVRIKESDVRGIQLLLFQKAKEGDPKFTYYGTVTFKEEYEDSSGNRRFIFSLDSWKTISGEISAILGTPLVSTSPSESATIKFHDPPTFTGLRYDTSSSTGSKRKGKINTKRNYDEDKKLGNSGEELVLKWEKKKLELYPKLLRRVKWISENDDLAGYDIRSFETSGEEIYIEVKTTRGNASREFYVSANEYEKSKAHSKKYRLYRLYEYNPKTGAECFVLNGSLESHNPDVWNYIFRPSKLMT